MRISGKHWDESLRAEIVRRLSVPGVSATRVAAEMGLRKASVVDLARRMRDANSSEFTQVYEKSDKLDKPRHRVPYRKADHDQFSTYEQIHGTARVKVRVKEWRVEPQSEEPVYRVLVIGDHHDKPGRDKTRALWIGRHAADTKPNAVVSIGDWASLDSLSSHEVPGSQNDADRPAFHEELDSLDESISMFHREFPTGSAPIFHVHGNHEHRVWRAANRQPKQSGDLPIRLENVFARYRWDTKPFGEFLDLFGVDFVHCPLNVMGREMGGENVERNVGNKSLRSLVFGHTHRANVLNITKVGQQRKLTIINVGTSMPWGTVEKYNGLSMTGWSYGVFELRIQAGQILSAKHFDMLELQDRYA